MKTFFLIAASLVGLVSVSATGAFSVNVHADDAAPATELKITQETSAELTTAGWNAFNAKNYDHAIAYAKECIRRYKDDAVAMQSELTEPVPTSDKDLVESKWALNDVGTCCFMLGQAFEKQGNAKDALKAYNALLEKFSFAQCWDPQGWFWKPADAAKKQIKLLEFQAMEDSE